MKTQIRNSVFETNSSSVHTLCIRKSGDVEKIWDILRKTGVTFGKTPAKTLEEYACKGVLELSNLTIQEKLDILFLSVIPYLDAEGYGITWFADFVKVFENEGVCVSVSLSEFSRSHEHYAHLASDEDTDFCVMRKGVPLTRDGIGMYLASEEAYHTIYFTNCYSGADEDCHDIYERFSKMDESERTLVLMGV